MSWQDRLSDLVIETAAGDRFVFEFKEVSNKRDEQTDTFQFANMGDYVQRRNSGTETFDLTVWLSGVDCDKNAQSFEDATRDTRPLKLTHPLKSKVYNVQLMSLQRNDNLAESANEVAFSIALHETIDLNNIVEPENVAKYIDNTVNTLNLFNSANWNNQIELKEPSALAKIKAGMKAAVAAVSTMSYAYSYSAKVLAELNAIALTADSLVDTIETNAESMADVQQGFIQFGAKGLQNPLDKLKLYDDNIAWIMDFLNVDPDADNDSDPLEVQLNAMAVLSGLALASISVDELTYSTKTNVFTQAQKIFDLAETIIDYTEAAEIAGLLTSTSEQLELINSVVTFSAGKLSDIAFRAKQERSFVITKPEEIYTFVYRKTGGGNMDDLDSKVDEFVRVNKIGGKELFELPVGRNVRFYL